MKKIILPLLVAGTVLSSCTTNPITGRSQLSLVSDAELQSMAKQEYTQFLSSNKVVSASASKDAEMVRRVGQRISNAVTTYYSQQGLSKELEGYSWEYNLVASDEANAWCMPGGKIVVYTGLLPITQNEAALAVVVGHEVAHALAKHGAERMSQGLIQELGGTALAVALANKPAQTQNLFLTAYGVGSNIGVMLPHSRKQELEADKLGLRFAAMAGYNPREAIGLWQRMAAAGSGGTPEFLSTHPDPGRRIQELEKQMNEALKYYNPVK